MCSNLVGLTSFFFSLSPSFDFGRISPNVVLLLMMMCSLYFFFVVVAGPLRNRYACTSLVRVLFMCANGMWPGFANRWIVKVNRMDHLHHRIICTSRLLLLLLLWLLFVLRKKKQSRTHARYIHISTSIHSESIRRWHTFSLQMCTEIHFLRSLSFSPAPDYFVSLAACRFRTYFFLSSLPFSDKRAQNGIGTLIATDFVYTCKTL